MNKDKLLQILKDDNIVIPIYILKNIKKLKLKMDEFIFLMYIYNKGDKLDFNPDKISKELNMDIMEVMGYVAVLADKGYISLDVKKSDSDVLEELINLDNFYDKISSLIMDFSVKESESEDIFKLIEEKLGRPLNSLEISTINGWIDNKVSNELIKEALKIAINNGVSSIKYVDKLIFEWVKSGVRTVDDLDKLSRPSKEDSNIDLEIGDWNWLDDEEEYITN